MSLRHTAGSLGACMLLGPAICGATDYLVNPTAGIPIQSYVDQCQPGDRVILGAGGFNQRVTINKPITLTGQGPDQSFINGQAEGGPLISVTCTGSVTISSLTVRDGWIQAPPDTDARGAGIFNAAATLSLSNVWVRSCIAWGGNIQDAKGGDALGAGVYSAGPLHVRNCSFLNNEAHGGEGILYPDVPNAGRGLGGGLYASAHLVVNQATFRSNVCFAGSYYSYHALAAGAGCCSESNESAIADSLFDSNFSRYTSTCCDGGRGAGFAQLGGQSTMRGCTFRDNNADDGGGYYNNGTSILEDSLIIGNLSRLGGGIMNDGNLIVRRSMLEANSAAAGAGFHNRSELVLQDSVLTNNTCSQNWWYYGWSPPAVMGGGGYNEGTAHIERCLITANFGQGGGGLVNSAEMHVVQSTIIANTAHEGAGIRNEAGTLFLDETVVRENASVGSYHSQSSHGYPSAVWAYGGGLYNSSTVFVRSCFFDGNRASAASPFYARAGAQGGAVLNRGSLAIERTTFHSNHVTGVRGYGAKDVAGGAVYNYADLAVSNSSFIENSAYSEDPQQLDGGAVFNVGAAAFVHCTFASNSLVAMGTEPWHMAGSAICASGLVVLCNTIVDDSTSAVARSLWGNFSSRGWNLIEDTGAMALAQRHPSDLLNVDPGLAPNTMLQGQLVCLLMPDSPALDGGSLAGAGPDQRGRPRPRDLPFHRNAADGSDIGAVEMGEVDRVLLAAWLAKQAWLARPHDRYVSLSGRHEPPFLTWANAATTIQAAIDVANPGDTIWVADGTYDRGGSFLESFALTRVALTKPLTVRSVNGPDATVIVGSTDQVTSARCAYVTNGASLIGFTLSNGYHAERGGGILCESTNARVADCRIMQCRAWLGAGVYGGSLSNCVLEENGTDSGEVMGGGGAHSAALFDCTLIRNSARYYGGGAANSVLMRCLLASNNVVYGGGGAYESQLANCLLYGNTAYGGGGAQASALNHCTVTDNTADYGGGTSGGSIRNSIVMYNHAPSIPGYNADNGTNYTAGSVIHHSCTEPAAQGAGNIASDPAFVDAALRDYHLRADSPCVDAGEGGEGETDLDGNARVIGASSDIGCYESPVSAAPLGISKLELAGGRPCLTWRAAEGQPCWLQRCVDLRLNIWTNVCPATNGLGAIIDMSAPTNALLLYRLAHP